MGNKHGCPVGDERQRKHGRIGYSQWISFIGRRPHGHRRHEKKSLLGLHRSVISLSWLFSPPITKAVMIQHAVSARIVLLAPYQLMVLIANNIPRAIPKDGGILSLLLLIRRRSECNPMTRQ